MLAALQGLHGLGQSGAGFGPVEKGRVESVCEQFGGSYWNGPQRDAHTLDPCSQEGSGQTHHSVSRHPAAGLWIQPEVTDIQGSDVCVKHNRQTLTV